MSIISWPYTLRAGHSDNPAEGACAMDAVNWLVHGEHGDAPECACPVIARFVIVGNDSMGDETRQRLLPYLHRIAGSRSGEHVMVRLRIIALSSVRIFLPMALRASDRLDMAVMFSNFPDNFSPKEYEQVAMVAASFTMNKSNSLLTCAAGAVECCAAWGRAENRRASNKISYYSPLEIRHAKSAAAAAGGCAQWAANTLDEKGGFYRAGEIAANKVWDEYFSVLDQALSAGPQGEPWSADQLEFAVDKYERAREAV